MVGCGIASGNVLPYSILVCRYDPPGNMQGETPFGPGAAQAVGEDAGFPPADQAVGEDAGAPPADQAVGEEGGGGDDGGGGDGDGN